MPLFVDARIPVMFGAVPTEGDAVFAPETGAVSHPAGCACCLTRSPFAAALDELFLRRVRGEMHWFDRVVVPGAHPGLRTAIETDPVLRARFRIG